MSKQKGRIAVLVWIFLVAQVVTAEDRLERLQPENRVLAERFSQFVARMDDKYFARVAALNGGAEYEEHFIENEYSDFDLRVTRGPVIEKAGRMLTVGHMTNPGRGDGELTWGRFYSLDFHPKTPLVGMLHATIVLQFFDNGRTAVGGWLGVMPGTRVEEDLAQLKAVTEAHFDAHAKDPSLYRRLICKGTHDTIEEWRRRPACVGASFYGPPVYRDDTARSYAFIEEMFDLFVGAYLDQVAVRANDAFTESDIAAQDAMRKRWLIDQLFSDPFASKIVPFEAWSIANMPPVVKF